MANFDKVFEHLMEIEGLYSNHKDDRGHETMYGITKATARAHGYKGDMSSLKLEEAKYIYEHSYFNNCGFDKIQNTKIATELTEFYVNTGRHKTAVSFLQRSFNLLNKNINLKEDGILGDKTAQTINNYKYYKSLHTVMNILQGSYYISLAEGDDKMKADLIDHEYTVGDVKAKSFIRGWIDRRISL